MIIRDYQERLAKEAHSILCSFSIAYLCMEVRTGKTLTAFHAAKLYGAKKVLFVTSAGQSAIQIPVSSAVPKSVGNAPKSSWFNTTMLFSFKALVMAIIALDVTLN